MKRKVLVLFTIFVLLFAFGSSVFAQSNQFQRFRGNWYAIQNYEIIQFLFIEDSYILYYDGIPEEIGYFDFTSNQITFHSQGFYDGDGWEWEDEEWDWTIDYRFTSGDVLVMDGLNFYRF